jgi:hypothetical protein
MCSYYTSPITQVKGDAHCLGRVSYYHESRHISHSVTHHKSVCVSFYNESGRVSHSVYRGRALEWCISISYPPYKTHSQQGQNNGGTRSCPVLTISFPFWRCPSKNLAVTKNKKRLVVSSPPLLSLLFLFLPL